MKVNVTLKREVEITLRPGDKISLRSTKLSSTETSVRRIVENYRGTYAVLANGTYRPLSTYGETWVNV